MGTSPRAAAGFAPLPGPGDSMAASRKMANGIITKALNAMRMCVCPERTSANKLSWERTFNFSSLGNSATRSAAIVSPGILMAGSLGNASINAFNGTAAAFRGISARLVASCQGSTLSRANAERTVSPVPFRASPMDAQRFVELRRWVATARLRSYYYPSFGICSATQSHARAVASAL